MAEAGEGSERKSEEERRAFWESKGSPLFGKVWTYDEIINTKPQKKRKAKDMETPKNWPKDTVIDNLSTWVFWLPEGWMQGIRTSAAGKVLKCYFSPEGKRFWHKKDVEKFLGVTLESREPVAKEEGETSVRLRFTTDEDAVPSWPDEDEDWLPKDWRLCFRQLPSGLHKCYIPPGQDAGFLFQKAQAQEYIATGGKVNLSKFQGSRFMTEVIKEAAEKGTSKCGPSMQPKKKKRKTTGSSRVAEPEDFEECSNLGVAAVPSASEDASASSLSADWKQQAAEVQTRLHDRGFGENTNVVVIHRRPGDANANHKLLDSLEGLYFQMPEEFGSKPCFQRVSLASAAGGLLCSGHFLFWNSSRTCWQVGNLDEAKAGFAFLSDDCTNPSTSSKPWMLLKESFLSPPEEPAKVDE